MSDTEPQAEENGESPRDPGAGEEAAPEETEAELRVEVSAEDFPREAADRAWNMLLDHPRFERELPGGDLWLVAFDVLDKEPDDTSRFQATVVDAITGRGVTVTGVLGDRESIDVRHRGSQHPPRDDEHAFAAEAVRSDEELGAALAENRLELYRPMPPLANVEHPDGSVQRVVTVGLRSTGGDVPRHDIVGVFTRTGELLREPFGALAPGTVDCGASPGPSSPAGTGPSQARVQVWAGEELLWDLVVVRPSASSATNGSGVELRQVDYKGQRVLARAHLPILNVSYDGDGSPTRCGPTYRDWLTDEASFEAEGAEPLEGFKVCTSPPRTVLDTRIDGGNFRGVALFLSGRELVLVSQIQAGWYRYVSEWRLGADGTILPRFGFSAGRNPCTCRPHTHHAYWRLDFDIAGPTPNLIQEFNDPPLVGVANWQTARFEVRRPRDPSRRRSWRVRDTRSGIGYSVLPGDHDGTADAYGAGDVWLLSYHEGELDDGQGYTSDPLLSRAQLDRFLSADPIHDADVVVWYAAHARHDEAAGEPAPHLLGPELRAFNWRPARVRQPYPELSP